MRNYIFSMILVLLLVGNFPMITQAAEANAPKLAEGAKSAILIEQNTGEILFEKNAHEQLPPASITKVMTLLIAMEELEKGALKLDEIVRVSERAASMGGSQVFLSPGEEITVEDLIKSIAIASGNDASVAIAERISGTEEAFVERMNEKAKQLGLENTNFRNSSGLPASNHYSSAYDLAIISQELLNYELITNYTSIYEDYLRKGKDNEFWLVNTNKLVRFYDGVDGLKTGFTRESKYGLSATAKRDNLRVIAVVLGADTSKVRNAMISQMLDYSFNHFDVHHIHDKDEVITNMDLLKANRENIEIVSEKPISILYKKGDTLDNIETEITLHEDINVPIMRGEEVGKFIVKREGETLFESPLTIKEDVKKASYFTLLKRTIKNMLKIN